MDVTPLRSSSVLAPRWGFITDLREIAHDFVRYRNLVYQLTLRDIRIRYKQAVMGFGWAILIPGLVVLSGLLVRLALAHVSEDPIQTREIAGVAVKAVPWGFFVGAIGFATASLTGNTALVTKVYFPREVLPLSSVLAMGFDSLIGAAAVAVILPFLGVGLSAGLVWVPILALLVFLLTLAAALFLSAANLFFRDVKYLVQILLTFGIFFTPVFFDGAMLGATVERIIMLNPLAPLLEGLRLCVVNGHNLLEPLIETTRRGPVQVWAPWYLGYSAAWTLLGLVGSALLFHRSEFVFAEYA